MTGYDKNKDGKIFQKINLKKHGVFSPCLIHYNLVIIDFCELNLTYVFLSFW